MNRTFIDRIKSLTSTTGTGTLTLTTAVAQFLGAAALVNGKTYDYLIRDVNGTAWEIGKGVYTSSGTTFTRPSGNLVASSTGSLISLSATGSTVEVILTSVLASYLTTAMQDHIAGCLITKSDSDTIAISAGTFWDPSSEKLVTYAGGTLDITPAGGALALWSVFGYGNAGTPTIEAFKEQPPTSAYYGSARQRLSGNAGRFLGCVAQNASNILLPQVQMGAGNISIVQYVDQDAGSAPYRLISAGAGTTFATEYSLAALIPKDVILRAFLGLTTTTDAAHSNGAISVSSDGASSNSSQYNCVSVTSGNPGVSAWTIVKRSTASIWVKAASSSNLYYVDACGFEFER